ncbi:heparan-alpha-glucosaminide N-acetyltransferase [Formosa agariphila KMM 3901]|uniref:Heparan-alpha-glucosaminide N-acetyltransferase n=1 Tax=Formosa agariphila (strain DSM 15362 / KCTC 12365 / LMG 23005 / KMM 3901 / M-2Alg 35-1) TaxID=1347342 RepID=T2KQD2_FORAG|nr:heparan-alpha-glucosaminide N-acetyltransferase domain-containing protein [Formosa agariphila]CDF81042.1 heparan-alpha-glucosaminide N-acetyltransferase [Formosa agariphila KMM 3901]
MKQRIESVDLLRGITIAAMILVNTPGDWGNVYAPLLHADWHGLTPTDLIFPFFLFIVGISIYYAYKNKTASVDVYKKVAVRSLKLIGLGLFLKLFTPIPPFFEALETIRIPGVLQRIGIVFFVTAWLYLNCNWKTLIGISITVLLGYWMFLGFVPFPDGTLPTFDRAPNNWSNYIDLKVLGKHMWKPDYDPEGILGTFPAIVTSILGVLVGKFLDSETTYKAIKLVAMGLVGVLLGYLWDLVFPINKALWSSSFVLVTAGMGTMILGLIYYIVDVKGWHFGALFKYAGMNAITVYFLSSLISKIFYKIPVGVGKNIHSWLYQTLFVHDALAANFSSLLYALTVVLCYLGLGYYLYRKNIFIKV